MLAIRHGCLILHGLDVDNIANNNLQHIPVECRINREKRDGEHYHITIMTAKEVKQCNFDINEIENISNCEFYGLVIGKISNDCTTVYYIEIVFPYAKDLRLKYNLADYDFHITLGYSFTDIHNISKLNNYNYPLQDYKFLLQYHFNADIVVNLYSRLKLGLTPTQEIQLLQKYDHLSLANVIADKHLKLKYNSGISIMAKLMNKYGDTIKDIYDYVVKQITQGEWYDIENFNHSQKVLNILNYPLYNKKKFDKFVKYYKYSNNKYTSFNMPRNYTWITDKLAGSGIIDKPEHYNLFEKIGVTDVIVLLDEPYKIEFNSISSINRHYFQIIDHNPPTVEQMRDIYQIIINSDSCIVHCLGGKGRTATIIICYLIMFNKISKNEALYMLKDRSTILTNDQQNFITEWSNLSHKPLTLNIKLPALIILVGYPASGKSTFSKALEENSDKIIRINQDEIRAKGQCEVMLSNNIKHKTVVLDRCNLTIDERKYWRNVAFNPKCWCIFFDTPFEECQYRITRRKNHPTVKNSQGITILNSVKNKLEEPTKKEGYDKIFIINNTDDSNNLLRIWGINPPIVEDIEPCLIKFPRTRHLVNLGSASRDDLVLSKNDAINFLNKTVYVEEKVDGANMGISISKDMKIECQNRSHYVNSSYHPQFKYLDKWISQHMSDLFDILTPGRHILYGEWLYAKHSIKYTKLSDLFIIFDIFDKYEQKFYSRNKVEQVLCNTNIKLVPLITKSIFTNLDDIINLHKSKSNFYDGLVEGVYIRICNDEWLIDRAKIVRSDFICGNQHWSKNRLEANIVELKV